MEMTRAPPAAQAERACPACSRELSDARCGYCGAVAQAGRWQVERVLAQTPHSRVYVAHDESGRRVALKELHFAAVPSIDQIEAFGREARMLEALKHPRVPAFLQSFTVGEGVHLRLYLAFELIEGESLAARLQRGKLSDAGLRDVAEQALQALVYLHSRTPAVVHRDVKPENMVFKPDGTLCLVDFGSVREISGSRTHRSTLVGTFGYMPPEQLGGTVDCSSDVYALGATLLNAATGEAPQPVSEAGFGLKVPKGLPGWLAQWLEGALPLDPKKRYRDARAALAALRRPSVMRRPVSALWVLPAAAIGLLLLGSALFGREEEAPPVTRPKVARPAAGMSAAAWFERVRTHCNSVEVMQTMRYDPPPSGNEGAGYGAACLALGGKTQQAAQLIDALPVKPPLKALGIVFDIAHPIADSGDDESTAPIMKLVVDRWPNHYMALYHLGVAEYGQGDYASAKDHLERFLTLYRQPDSFTGTAKRALAAIAKGAPYPPLDAAR